MNERSLAAVTIAAAVLAVPALGADTSRVEVFGGYSLVHVEDETLHGWNAALGVGVSGPFSLVLDASGHYGSTEGHDRSQLNLSLGPAMAFWRDKPGSLFVHALFGLYRDSAGIRIFDVSITETHTRFGMLFGGGVEVRAAKRWAIRVQGDYFYARSVVDDSRGVLISPSQSGVRASIGVVYRPGIQ